MDIDSRLNEIDDCLYRVAIRMLIVQDNKVLLVKEHEDWWAFPGGGVNHGETVEATLAREAEEELGVPAETITSDFKIAYYKIGNVVKGIPRMNIFFKASAPAELIKKTNQITKWGWFTRDELLSLNINSSYDKVALARVIFDE